MCVNTYRLFYLANTEDIFIRFQVGHPSSISTSTSTSTSTPTPTSTPWMKDGATWLPDFYQALMKKSIFTKKSKANASSSYYASMPFSSTNSIMTLVHATTPPTTKNIPSPNSLTPTEFKENEKETEKEKEKDIESEKEKEMKLATDTATEIKKETEKEMNHVHEDFKKTEIEIKKEPDDDPAHPDLTFTLPSSSTMSATSSSSSAPYIHTVPLSSTVSFPFDLLPELTEACHHWFLGHPPFDFQTSKTIYDTTLGAYITEPILSLTSSVSPHSHPLPR
ncbi:hypothetical protein HMI54_006782 [Coelomomyces lativittatus]|nr:hypothetical protein HMI54_006782 [Coelomomyces lativittatus]